VNEFIAILLTIGFGGLIAVSMLAMAIFFGPKNATPTKLEPFECGVKPVSDPRGRFSVNFYLVAILFVMFDVEVVFLYPWAVTFRSLGIAGFVEMTLFIIILLLGLFYAIKRGVLAWD